MIKKVRQRHKSIFLALFSLMVTSGVSGYYIFKPDSLATLKQISSRAPASIKPVDEVNLGTTFFASEDIKKQTTFETELNFDCNELLANANKNVPTMVSSDHIILKLSRCDSSITQLKKIELNNKTNGYNAQLFKLSDAEFNSDFIQLEKGINQLEFEISLIDGQKKLQIVKIQRNE